MNKFLKDLMKLATELNQANGFDAIVVINEMELLYDKHIAELKKLAIPDVRQQSELLKAFCSMLLNAGDLTQQISDDEIDSFLKAFNCA